MNVHSRISTHPLNLKISRLFVAVEQVDLKLANSNERWQRIDALSTFNPARQEALKQACDVEKLTKLGYFRAIDQH